MPLIFWLITAYLFNKLFRKPLYPLELYYELCKPRECSNLLQEQAELWSPCDPHGLLAAWTHKYPAVILNIFLKYFLTLPYSHRKDICGQYLCKEKQYCRKTYVAGFVSQLGIYKRRH